MCYLDCLPLHLNTSFGLKLWVSGRSERSGGVWWSGGGGWGVGGGCELVRGVEEEALAKTWGQGGLTQSPSVGPWLGLSALKFWEMPSS